MEPGSTRPCSCLEGRGRRADRASITGSAAAQHLIDRGCLQRRRQRRLTKSCAVFLHGGARRLHFYLTLEERALGDCNAHHAETVPMISGFTGIDPATIAVMVRPIWALTLDPKDLQPTIDAAAKGKLIDKAFDARDLMSPP